MLITKQPAKQSAAPDSYGVHAYGFKRKYFPSLAVLTQTTLFSQINVSLSPQAALISRYTNALIYYKQSQDIKTSVSLFTNIFVMRLQKINQEIA